MKPSPFETLKLDALRDKTTDAIAGAIALLVYAAQRLLALSDAFEPDLLTRIAVARSKTVIGELEAQRRADDSGPFSRGGGS